MPAKLIGAANWLLQPGFPVLSGEEGNEQIHVQFIADAGLMATILPEYGTKFYDIRMPFFNSFDKLVLTQRNISMIPGLVTYTIDLVYSMPEEMERYSYRGIDDCAPIEQHPKYEVGWNHFLIKNDKYPSETFDDSYWKEKFLELTPPKSNYFRILNANDSVPDGWHIEKTPSKPGVETFKYSYPQVTYRKMSLYRDDLESVAALDNTIQTPGETFGKEGYEWLQGSSSIDKEGRFWVLTVSYTGSKDVDEDIYDGSI